jgi:2-(1,2-epoxy-1,2-dihydrophenyl)acetyl-CoA isomerase
VTEYSTIELTIDDGIARLTLARPEANNAMTPLFFSEFGDAANVIATRGADVRAVLLRSSGRFFSVGGDVRSFTEDLDAAPAKVFNGTFPMHAGLARLRRIDAPVVAAVQGTAMGGAVSVLSTCDVIISARSASFGAAYSRLGFSPDLGATQGLASRMGVSRARRFLLLAETLDADQALAAGLVDEVVDDGAVESRSESLVQGLAQGPTRAYGEIRRLVTRALALPFEATLEDEAQGLARMAATADAREGLTAFTEKREPRFEGN